MTVPNIKTCKQCGWSGVALSGRCKPCKARANKKWSKKNPDKFKQYRKRWLERRLAKQPDYLVPIISARRLRLAQWFRAGTATNEELKAIWNRDGGKCKYCGSPVLSFSFRRYAPKGFDHVIPRCKGGKHEASNMVVCCMPCNHRKGYEQDYASKP